jgi:tight adherence protein B
MSLILFMAAITAVGGFMIVILIHSYREYRKQKLIRLLERQMVAPRAKRSFSLLEALGYNNLITDISNLLNRAGLSRINAEDAFLTFVVLDILIFAAMVMLGFGWLSAVVPAVLVFAVPWFLNMVGTRRHVKLNHQFAEAVQDIADHLKIVPNLENAIRKVAEETDQPLRGELNRILHKVDTGINLLTALRDFARTSESTMIDFWVDSIVFAYQMRASVADVCEEVSKKIKQRMKQNAQVSTKLTEIKTMMFGIAGVMAGIMFFIFSSSPEFSAAFNTIVGKVALAYTTASYAGSTLYILRRINKEVSEL